MCCELVDLFSEAIWCGKKRQSTEPKANKANVTVSIEGRDSQPSDWLTAIKLVTGKRERVMVTVIFLIYF